MEFSSLKVSFNHPEGKQKKSFFYFLCMMKEKLSYMACGFLPWVCHFTTIFAVANDVNICHLFVRMLGLPIRKCD